jgi:uncharacterized protein YdeI (YjbR/CyaY-like superfamily)
MMSKTDFSNLSRPIHPMPRFVLDALTESGLFSEYEQRPPYQQNNYIGWINCAKRVETQQKRLHQVLYELKRGDLYMKMDYNPRRKEE